MDVRRGVAVLGLLSMLLGGFPAWASSSAQSIRMRELASVRALEDDVRSFVWDMAFQGDLLAASIDGHDPDRPDDVEGLVMFRMLDGPPYLRRLSFFRCRGVYGDVALWKRWAFIGVPNIPNPNEAPNDQSTHRCNGPNDSTGKSGIRIVDISDPRAPRQVGFVRTPCGSQRLSLISRAERLYVYGAHDCPENMPEVIGGGYAGLSVVCFDPKHPTKARICSKPDITPYTGCVDVVYIAAKQIVACVDVRGTGLLDVSDPVNPKLVGETEVTGGIPQTAGFSWDGRYLIVSDAGLNSGGEGCTGDSETMRQTLVVFDVEDPTAPREVSRWALPRAATYCFPGFVGALPMKDGRRLAGVAWAGGGMSVLDLSDADAPREVAFRDWDTEGGPAEPSYAAYWFNGRFYAAHGRFVSVLRMPGLGRRSVHYFRHRYNPQSMIEDFR